MGASNRATYSKCLAERLQLKKQTSAQESTLRRLLLEHEALARNVDNKSRLLTRLRHTIATTPVGEFQKSKCHRAVKREEDAKKDEKNEDLAEQLVNLYHSVVEEKDNAYVDSLMDQGARTMSAHSFTEMENEYSDVWSDSLYTGENEQYETSHADAERLESGHTGTDQQEPLVYCLYRSEDGETNRLLRLRSAHTVLAALLEKRADRLAEKVCQATEIKRSLLKRIERLRRQVREVSFQLFDLKLSNDIFGQASRKPGPCKSKCKKRHTL